MPQWIRDIILKSREWEAMLAAGAAPGAPPAGAPPGAAKAPATETTDDLPF